MLLYDGADRVTGTYDALVTSSQDALGLWSYVQYDGAGNAVQRTDPRGWVSTFTYDSLNRLQTAFTQDGSREMYAHDPASRLSNLAYSTATAGGLQHVSRDLRAFR